MIVLGIDPGLAITGCAIVEDIKGNQGLLFSNGIITSSHDKLSSRLWAIYTHIKILLDKFQPDIAVMENLFFNTNAKSAFLVGQARGVINLALFQSETPVIEYTPLEVKMAITGYGRAEKTQIQSMIKQLLKLPKVLTPDDVADAAAIALTHCFSAKMQNNLKKTLHGVK